MSNKISVQVTRIIVFILFVILFSLAFTSRSAAAGKKNKKENWPIIVRHGDRLYEGERPFRFFGLAAPNIQQNETQISPDNSNRFPDEYEIRDILGGLKSMGGRVTRTFSLSVFHQDDKGIPVYISARHTYNEEAFKCLDLVIALCHEYDVRLIIPFIASQSFRGIRGVDEFAALSGKPGSSFWTDESVKADFRHFLDFVINRKNTVSGILYKDDPAILAWQLGNEFGSYSGDRKLDYNEWSPKIEAWSSEMASYIKKTDPNHLIMEAGGYDRTAMLNDPNIDIISEHLYEYWNKMGGRPSDLGPIARQSWNMCKGKKPLIVDEFGLGTTENLKNLMKEIRESDISGGLLWSIRGHRRDGGWYYHNEGGTPINSFHVPGFAAGSQYDETRILDLLRKEAFLIRGVKPGNTDKPSPEPVLMRQGDGFTWRGSTGAQSYTIERAEGNKGPWKVLTSGLHDSIVFDVASFEYTPQASNPLTLYTDESSLAGKTYYYRIKAHNAAGESGYSNILEVNY